MKQKIHSSITTERLEEAMKESLFGDSNMGICVACGEDQYGVEPDAEKYLCESCGTYAVYGVETLAISVL